MKLIRRVTGITIASGAPLDYGIHGKTEDTTAGLTNTASEIEIEGSAFSVAGYVTSTHTVTADDRVFAVTESRHVCVSLQDSYFDARHSHGGLKRRSRLESNAPRT